MEALSTIKNTREPKGISHKEVPVKKLIFWSFMKQNEDASNQKVLL